MAKIKIVVNNAEAKIDYIGFQGKSCDVAEQIIFKNLRLNGVNVNLIKRQNKPEYYQERGAERNENKDLSL
ncbi:hypothetical protein AZ270_gp10 [Acidianus tailed spindle virus]|uniref:hypothetical protein n=1 Tax=Acidianus tailed spindle virus TaxID=1797140 RepID=UPI00076F2D25|nr:hypothetical protein AZ270_gp10 [Acidianus tailed spindle virus]AME30033.1 hypothetical protein ATSV_C70 [Acidianus tailed spindle virus]